MAEFVNPPAASRSFGETQRHDTWWIEIIPVVVLLGGFGLYATLRAFEGCFYEWGPYLSPFYSPLIDRNHHWWPFSPALLILAGPLGFRVTCYYYRKAYYRAFFLAPPACAVSEGRKSYRGETAFPFILQNVHRYFFYLAVSALAREESRGAHSRIDFQKLDPAWGAKNSIIEGDREAMKLRQERVPEMPGELRSLLAEEKGETARRT